MDHILIMNDAETLEIVALIRRRLAELSAQDLLGQDGQSVVQLDQQSVGRLSRMDALQSQAMAKAQQVRRDTERRGLQAALARVEDGEFGWCEDCGEAIAPGRLRLNPASTRCVSCAAG